MNLSPKMYPTECLYDFKRGKRGELYKMTCLVKEDALDLTA